MADRRSHEFLVDALASNRPGDAVLSEEGADDARRLSEDRVWIVDPLDGTWEFGEPGRTDWAVHVAVWERGALTAGAVALPAQHVVYSTGEPVGLPARADRAPLVVVSRTRAPGFAAEVTATIGGSLTTLGSAGAKAMAVLRGDVDIYLHGGGQHEWDAAAPIAVTRAAGLHASRIDGSEFVFNQPTPRTDDLLICRPELAERVLAAVSAAERRSES